MKHLADKEELRAQLLSQAAVVGVELSDDQARSLLKYLDLVLTRNERVNLTRIVDPSEGVRLHLVDSLALLPYLKDMDASHLFCDLGAGAGFPGIPVLLASSSNGLFIDSVARKVEAMNFFIEALDLEKRASAQAIRAEELAQQTPERFDAVFVRAVSSLPSLLELASPLLHSGGRLFAMKGITGTVEVESATLASKLVGMELESSHRYRLPGDVGENRTLYIYRKTTPPTRPLPRRTGLAQRRPLA